MCLTNRLFLSPNHYHDVSYFKHAFTLFLPFHNRLIRPNRVAWLATDRLSLLAILDPELELFLALDPLCDEALAGQMAEGLRQILMDKRMQADMLL